MLPLFEIARLLVCFYHITSVIVNANHGINAVQNRQLAVETHKAVMRSLTHPQSAKRIGQRFGGANLESISFKLFFLSVRRTITKSTWAEIHTAYASGIGLREIARNMGIPEGTVLARAKREGWTREIQNAKALAKREDAPLAVTFAVRSCRRSFE